MVRMYNVQCLPFYFLQVIILALIITASKVQSVRLRTSSNAKIVMKKLIEATRYSPDKSLM